MILVVDGHCCEDVWAHFTEKKRFWNWERYQRVIGIEANETVRALSRYRNSKKNLLNLDEMGYYSVGTVVQNVRI